MYIEPSVIIRLLMLTYNYQQPERTQPTIQEQELHNALKIMIDQCVQDISFEFESTSRLEFLDERRPVVAEAVTGHECISEEDIDEATPEELEESCSTHSTGGLISEEYKKKAVEYWRSGKTGPLRLQTVQAKFKKVKHERQLHRWEKYLKKGGTKHEKLTRISEYVLNNFLISIDQNLIIHDVNLRMWALEANKEVKLNNFKASRSWILNFKKYYRIVSRKITNFISRSFGTDDDEVSATALDFVEKTRPQIKEYGAENTFNADESGFNLELYSGRTLSQKGIKTVECTAQSISSTTHSYTILPLISATGQLMSPLTIILKEKDGVFGPRVQEHLFQAPNVYLEASTSGKFTSKLFQKWFKDVYLQRTGSRSLLLLDSWTGHCSASLSRHVPADKDIQILTIPKKTTGQIQPLDVYGFRVWKQFVRRFSEQLENYNVNLHTRNDVIKLQSLTHNQLSAPRYKNLFAYAWHRSGYIETEPERFEDPVKFGFSFTDLDYYPSCFICRKPAVIRCSRCNQFLCFEHFYTDYHYHDE